MTTALIYHPRYLDHDCDQPRALATLDNPGMGPACHPENPRRLRAILARLQKSPFWRQLRQLQPLPATLPQIHAVHDPIYVNRLEVACSSGLAYLDSDTYINRHSFEVALLAAGGVLTAIDAVMAGPSNRLADGLPGVRNAFCAVRPPGHHAERDQAMGFCLLNNVAIGAKHLLDRYRLERVAVVDFDVHHGNGTQHLFEDEPRVFFASIHEHPRFLYPGSGYAHEKGSGPGLGHTLNIPLEPGGDDQTYRGMFLEQLLPALDRYRPQFLLVSAGFDASCRDPLAHMKLSPAGFTWMTQQLKIMAERHAAGRLVSVLEGGYDPQALAENVMRHVEQLLLPQEHDPFESIMVQGH